MVADDSIGGHPREGWGLIGSNDGLPTFAAVIRARHIAIRAEYHEGRDLAEMFTVLRRISSLFPLRLYGRSLSPCHRVPLMVTVVAERFREQMTGKRPRMKTNPMTRTGSKSRILHTVRRKEERDLFKHTG